MEKGKLGDFVSFVPGINQSRVEKQLEVQEIEFYDQSSFEYDYSQREAAVEDVPNNFFNHELAVNSGDIVISNSLRQATMVGQRNAGKLLSLNFTKVEFDSDRLNKYYFIYLFNVYKDIQRQKERGIQGGSLTMRITQQSLAQMTIPLVPLQDQKTIGEIYIESVRLQSKLAIYGELLEQVTKNVLEERLKE